MSFTLINSITFQTYSISCYRLKKGLTSSELNFNFDKQSSSYFPERCKHLTLIKITALLQYLIFFLPLRRSANSTDTVINTSSTQLNNGKEYSLEKKEKQIEDGEEKSSEEERAEEESGSINIKIHEAAEFKPTEASALNSCVDETEVSCDPYGTNVQRSFERSISEGDSYHCVWRPRKQPRLPDLVVNAKELQERRRKSLHESRTKPLLKRSASRMSLMVRQQHLIDRVQATQAVLKESTDEILGSPVAEKPTISFREASKRIISDRKRHNQNRNRLSDIVTQYLAKYESEREAHIPLDHQTPTSPGNSAGYSKRELCKTRSTQGIVGAIPIEEWHKLTGDN